jgi:hypothetical protein
MVLCVTAGLAAFGVLFPPPARDAIRTIRTTSAPRQISITFLAVWRFFGDWDGLGGD